MILYSSIVGIADVNHLVFIYIYIYIFLPLPDGLVIRYELWALIVFYTFFVASGIIIVHLEHISGTA